MVMHAIVAYPVGGALDLYYYPNGIPGTAIATKELSEFPNQGPSSRNFSCYEIAMFTRYSLNLEDAKNQNTPFGKSHSNMDHIMKWYRPVQCWNLA